MANKDKKKVFDEINEFVCQNGTGINETGEIYNKTVYFRIFDFLYNEDIANAIMSVERVKNYNYRQIEIKPIYYNNIASIVERYKPEAGMTFVSYVAQRVIWKLQEENRKLKKEAGLFPSEEDDKETDDAFTKTIDDAMLKEQGHLDNDIKLLKEERIESICDLLYDIMQVIEKQKRTKAEIFRILYTDRIITAFSDYRRERKQEFKHEKQIFDNMERPLVDYVFAKMVNSLRDMSYSELKTVKDLMDYYSDLEEDKEEVEKRYLSVWGIKEKKHPEYEVKLPLSNAVFLAYIFIKEYEQSMRRVIPEPHQPAYISNYSKEFNELMDSFNTSEMYG